MAAKLANYFISNKRGGRGREEGVVLSYEVIKLLFAV